MTKFKNYIFNEKNLILFWFCCLFFQHFITQLLLPESIRAVIWHALWVIDILWTTVVLIYDIYQKKINFKDSKIVVLSLFVLINTISWLLFNEHGPYYIFTLVTLYEQAFIFYAYANKNDIKELFIKLAYAFIGLVSFYTIVSLICYVVGYTSFVLPNGTEITMLGVDNALAHKTRFMGIWTWYTVASFDCYIAILLSLYLLDLKKNKIFHITMIILNSIMIYLTDSRSSLIVLAFIYLCFILFLLQKKIGTKKTIITGIGLILVGGINFISLKVMKNPSLLSGNLYQTLRTLSSGRLQMAEGILNNLKNSWLLGNGYCNNEFVLTNYGIQHPHNVIMAVILYSGITGLVLFTIFIILNICTITKNIHYIFSNNLKWILVLVICIFIESMFDICIIGAPVNIQTLYFWLCLGFITNSNYSN